MKSTPEMMLAKFAAENNNDKIKVNAEIGELPALYVWAKSNGNLVSLYSAISIEKLTHFKLNHWIFQANQEIEQYIAAQEMVLRVAA